MIDLAVIVTYAIIDAKLLAVEPQFTEYDIDRLTR